MDKLTKLMREHREAEDHQLVGGDLSLDFANTLNGHASPTGHEYLKDCRDFILWSRHAGLITLNEARLFLKKAVARPTDAKKVLQNALTLRELIFRIFTPLAVGDEPDTRDLDLLNSIWQDGQRHARLIPSPGGFTLGWDDEPSLQHTLRALSAAAVHLLMSQNIRRIRKCSGKDCDWLFIDTSRNHMRLWCSMDDCGNRAKMRRRQQRKRLAVRTIS